MTLRFFLALSWLILISIAMLTPGKDLPEVNFFDFQDKFIHLFCFSIQAYLWAGVGIKKNEQLSKSTRLWINFLGFGILVGILLETIQQAIPNRSFEWMDLLVNVVGGVLGFFAYLKWPSIKFILD
jgi:VanZ family protein